MYIRLFYILFLLYFLNIIFFVFFSDVIHTVGPRGEKPDKLRECYESCLSLVKENNLRSVAFPCISTGVYGYPQAPAARVALATVKKFLVENKDSVSLFDF